MQHQKLSEDKTYYGSKRSVKFCLKRLEMNATVSATANEQNFCVFRNILRIILKRFTNVSETNYQIMYGICLLHNRRKQQPPLLKICRVTFCTNVVNICIGIIVNSPQSNVP